MKTMDEHLSQLLSRAMELRRLGHWTEAKAIYLDIAWQSRLNWSPVNLRTALNGLGVLECQLDNFPKAIVHFIESLHLSSQQSEVFNNLGHAYHGLRKFDEALAAYQQAIQLDPSAIDPRLNLGRLYLDRGELDLAEGQFRSLLSVGQSSTQLWNNLGVLYQKQNRWLDSIDCLHRALDTKPNDILAASNLAISLIRCSRVDEALTMLERILAVAPNQPLLLKRIADASRSIGDLSLAVQSLEQVVTLVPGDFEAWVNLGLVYNDRGSPEQAKIAYQQAMAVEPSCVEAHFNLGLSLHSEGRLDEAIGCFHTANDLRPGYADSSLIPILQGLCRWEELEVPVARVLEKLQSSDDSSVPMAPFTVMTLPVETTADQQLQSARRHAARISGALGTCQLSDPNRRNPKRTSKIRVGYLSADFREHAVGYLIPELIESHDRDCFEVFGYSIGPDDQSVQRKRIIAAFDCFCDARAMSDRELAARIADDQIDILIDLQGYTQFARTTVLAQRAAPIQINYLGFPGTMGADFIDYIIVDDFVVPVDQQPFFSEQRLVLPGCYQANDSRALDGTVEATRLEQGFAPDEIVCCSFNNPYKITRELFDAWLELLALQPRAILWLLEGGDEVNRRLRDRACAKNIDPKRLRFAPRLSRSSHLSRLKVADLFLDSFPISAHTTASDCLRVGVPIVTRVGVAFISRVAGSLLTALGMTELITDSAEAYFEKCRQLVEDPQALHDVRIRLASRLQTSDVFDGRCHAKKLDALLKSLAARSFPNPQA